MDQDYIIEELASTFAQHAEMAEAHHKQLIEQFRENFPEQQELPEPLKNGFNVSRALSVMCAEIEKLKNICS